jgi:hypothetical protein
LCLFVGVEDKLDIPAVAVTFHCVFIGFGHLCLILLVLSLQLYPIIKT